MTLLDRHDVREKAFLLFFLFDDFTVGVDLPDAWSAQLSENLLVIDRSRKISSWKATII